MTTKKQSSALDFHAKKEGGSWPPPMSFMQFGYLAASSALVSLDPMGIERGLSASGTSRSSSMWRRPCWRLAATTLM